jgi:hypothetical protein
MKNVRVRIFKNRCRKHFEKQIALAQPPAKHSRLGFRGRKPALASFPGAPLKPAASYQERDTEKQKGHIMVSWTA